MAGEETFPYQRPCPFAPPPRYRWLLDEAPVSRVRMAGGNLAWLVARYDDVRAVLGSGATSVDRRNPGFPRFAAATPEQRQESYRGFAPPMNWLDGAPHARARRSVVGEFAPRRVEAMRPWIGRIVDDALDRMLAGQNPVDLVAALALPVPSAVICRLLGIPYAERARFEADADRMLRRGTPADERTRAAHGIRRFLSEVVSRKEKRPTDDLLGRLIRRREREGVPDHEAVVSMAFVLLTAGHVTTANLIALGVLALLSHPDQRAFMLSGPRQLADTVDELLRYFSIVDAATSRVATRDIEVGGVLIRAGEGIVALGPAANRDPAVFERPDEFDPARPRRHHLAFGFGRHQCVGQHLARVEVQIALSALFRRVDTLRLAVPESRLSYKNDANIFGLDELPVTW